MIEEGVIEIKDSAHEEQDYPDGGMNAWGVVFASFMAQFIVWGSIYSFGVYNNYYITAGVSIVGNSTDISFIGGVGNVFIPALGIISGKLAQRYGFRQVVFAGSILTFLGVFLASFTTSLPLLILTQGALCGIGGSMIYFPAVALPSQWFNKNRGLAQGIAAAGSGLGGLAFSVAIQKMLDTIGLAWTLRTSAIFFGVTLVAINPLFKTRIQSSKNSKMDYTILKDARFMFLLFAGFFANFALFVGVDFIPVFAAQKANISVADSATLLAIYNGFGAVGKVLMGLGADKIFGRSNALIICMWITMVSYFSWLAASNFTGIAVFAAVNGTVGGGFWALLPVVISSFFGVEGLVSRVTLLYTALAAGNFAGPIVAAVIQDHYGLDWMVIYAGIIALAAAVCGTTARFLNDSAVFKKV
ncbi:MFS general substrate transporter [Rhizoclosmatium globosum]|uniref:MFS general substrate transporter n=1 Tax=Rhizoclosmatium globosum TaxID=329046 RepID=A0A1Y2CIV7_9FUNG|nr:MFS general substrate transporter [Rhizoclosmatium globosum]|eukprot:ORY46959.1 MFS general substrate transporter [Rhizoclosmatium globosum]